MNWIVYDRNFQRSKRVARILLNRCGIQAHIYKEAFHAASMATLLVHCDALDQSFIQLAMLKQTGKYLIRFYCTDEKQRCPEVPFVPDECERLVTER